MSIQIGQRRPSRVGAPDIALLRDGTYAVLAETCTMGFIEQTGNVFVALSGSEQSHAVEVGQSLSFDIAVSMVERAYRR